MRVDIRSVCCRLNSICRKLHTCQTKPFEIIIQYFAMSNHLNAFRLFTVSSGFSCAICCMGFRAGGITKVFTVHRFMSFILILLESASYEQNQSETYEHSVKPFESIDVTEFKNLMLILFWNFLC